MLPRNLKYGSKIESAAAKSVRTNIQPATGNIFNLGDTITINIPTRQNLVLVPSESYLRFDVLPMKCAGASALRWDSCGAHGVIQRIRIWHGANLLQDIDNYGLLCKIMYDIQVSTDQCYGKSNVLVGTRSDLVLTTLPVAASVAATDFDSGAHMKTYFDANLVGGLALSAKQVNSGDIIKNGSGANTLVGTATTVTETTGTNTYCLNLLSLIGSLCHQNYIPLFSMTSAPLRCEITLVDSLVKCLNTVSAATLTKDSNFIGNVEYVAQFIELGDQAMGMVGESLQGQPIQFVVPDYRNFQNSFAIATGGQINLPIPAKFTSLKSLFVTSRDKLTGVEAYFPFSCVKNGLSSYYFRVGASIVPTKAPSSTQEMFSEVMKAIGSLSDINHTPSIEKASYELAVSAANTVALEANGASNINSGSFYIGLDLENYSGASKDTIFAGWNSNTDDIYLVLNYGTVTATSLRYDAFALFDCVVVFENNTAYVRY